MSPLRRGDIGLDAYRVIELGCGLCHTLGPQIKNAHAIARFTQASGDVGAQAGLGADVARRLSEAGYRVGIFDLGAERVAQTASELDNAVGIEADVTSPER